MADITSGPGPDEALTPGGPRATTVLLVEDHEVVRREVGVMLAQAGWRVVAAVATAAEGRRVAGDLQPDVAVIDTELPDGSGVDLCRDLRDLAPRTVMIMHAATLMPGQARLAREAGASEVVLKAIDCRPLLRAIGRRATPV